MQIIMDVRMNTFQVLEKNTSDGKKKNIYFEMKPKNKTKVTHEPQEISAYI